jgi:tetratricopeptide (TPR) repeat protein
VIRRALDQLRPPDWQPDQSPRTLAARRYAVLIEHFLRDRTLRSLASDWNIDERTCRRDLAHGLDELTRLLQAQEQALLQSINAHPALSLELIPPLAAYSPLIGRHALLKQLLDTLAADGRTIALYGLPGIGKTALLVHLAHQDALRSRFPDGVLWAHLGEQADLSCVLRTWALALGLSPADVQELTQMNALNQVIHAQLLRRRMLIVLDDVWHTADAHALRLGGSAACYLLSTRFPALAIELASPGQTFEVPGLTPEDSRQLLDAFLPQATQLFPDQTAALIAHYDGLPLLLSLAGRHLASAYQRGHHIRLQRELVRLLHNRAEDGSKVQAAFNQLLEASLRYLQPDHREALYALTALPPKPATFDETMFQIVTGQSEQTLDALMDAGLLISEQTSYCLHGLIHDALSKDTSPEAALARRAGQARLVSYAIAHGAALFAPGTNNAAVECCYPPLPLASLRAALDLEDLDALSRLVELALPYLRRRGLLSLADQLLDKATQSDVGSERWARLVAQRVDVLIYLGQIETARRQLITLRRWDDQQPPGCRAFIFEARARLALSAGRLIRAYALAQHGWRCAQQQEGEPPIDLLLELLQIQVSALNNMGRYAYAVRLTRRLLKLARQHRLADEHTQALYSAATLERQQGNYDKALRYAQRALRQAKQQGNHYYSALAATLIGILANDQGEQSQAVIAFAEAETLAKTLGLPRPLYQLRHAQGVLAMRRARWDEAETLLREALAHAQDAGLQIAVANVQIELGECLLAQQKLDQSEQHLRAGLALAEALGAADIAALLRYNLGRLAQARDQHALALALGQQAYHQLRSSGHYRADEVGRWMRTLPRE